ncbi:MAG: hypothetical protein GDA46_06175 [Bdellovibrionales bacterium]|nr:hypothetical protein [Bdellovibrionales bacterium]
MRLQIKLLLIALFLFSFKSFAIPEDYVSVFKISKKKEIKTFSEFQSQIKKDISEIKRAVAKSSILVSAKKENKKEKKKEL